MQPRIAPLLVALAALVPSLAHATPPRVETIPIGQEPTEPLIEPEDGRAVGTFGAWGAGFRLGDLELTFADSEIADANGSQLRVPDRANVGGITYGAGYRPFSWLRLPEIRLRFGGGSASAPAAPLAGSSGLEARSTRFFIGAIDLVIGFEQQLRRVTPFIRGYATAGFASVRAEVSHPELGALGAERAVRGWVGLGVEAGFIVNIHEVLGLTVAYRHGLYGPEGHSVTFGLAITGED